VLWCFDIAQYVGNGVTYTEVTDPLGAERASLLNRLFTSYYESDRRQPLEGAAFQVAIWEIVYENHRRGRLSMSPAAACSTAWNNAGVVTDLANTWLGNLGSGENYQYQVSRIPATNQDLLTAAPVPLPAGVSCYSATGLGAFGLRASALRQMPA
jgi:hypothetical protein